VSKPDDAIIILDEVMYIEQQVHEGMIEMKRLTDLYNLGYRYITKDGEPHMGHANVVNIADRLI